MVVFSILWVFLLLITLLIIFPLITFLHFCKSKKLNLFIYLFSFKKFILWSCRFAKVKNWLLEKEQIHFCVCKKWNLWLFSKSPIWTCKTKNMTPLKNIPFFGLAKKFHFVFQGFLFLVLLTHKTKKWTRKKKSGTFCSFIAFVFKEFIFWSFELAKLKNMTSWKRKKSSFSRLVKTKIIIVIIIFKESIFGLVSFLKRKNHFFSMQKKK